MAQTGVVGWSKTAATNATADTNVNWAEGQAPSTVNNSARAQMASIAMWRDDNNGSLTTGGTTTAYTLTTNQAFAALTANYQICFCPNAANTGTTTINVDGLGAKPLRSAPAVELNSGALVAGVPYRATYFTSNSGEWILHGAAAPPSYLFKSLSVGETGSNVTTAQPWFPTAGAVTLSANKTYRFRGLLFLSRSTGTNSHSTSILFGGTATISTILYHAISHTSDTNQAAAAQRALSGATTAIVVKTASISATELASFLVEGTLRVTTGGTLIPQFQYSAAPGGAPAIAANSFFELFEIGSDTVTAAGTWA